MNSPDTTQNQTTPTPQGNYSIIKQTLFALFIIACLLPWLELLSHMRLNADSAWLTAGAEKFLAGQRMIDGYFDTNPPMSFLIFIPVAFIKNLGIDTNSALNIYTLFVSIISVISCALLLSKWKINQAQSWTILISFIISITLASTYAYANKDHLSAIALLPFLLAQLSMLHNIKTGKTLRIFIFIFFCPFILLKPHYTILAGLLILHRLITKKNLQALLRADAAVLLMGGLAYITVVWLFFPSYFDVALPASLDLYVTEAVYTHILHFGLGFVALNTCLLLLAYLSERHEKARPIAILLPIAAIVCTLIFMIQNKGFGPHLVPALCFTLPAIALTISLYVPIRTLLLIPITIALFTGGTARLYANTQDLRTNFLDNNEASKLVKGTEDGSPFYIEYFSTDYVIPLAEYTGHPYASRFPTNWFTSLNTLSDEKREYYSSLFGKMVAEDIEKYKPTIMLLDTSSEYFTLLNTFSNIPEFKQALAAYTLSGNVSPERFKVFRPELNRAEPINFAVYKRIN